MVDLTLERFRELKWGGISVCVHLDFCPDFFPGVEQYVSG